MGDLRVKNQDEMIEAIRKLPKFFEKYLDEINSKLIDYSMLKVVLLLKKGQGLWGYFCTLINFQMQVNKFLIPMGSAIAEGITKFHEGDFEKFILAPEREQRDLLENLEWQYKNSKGKYVKVEGWRHRFYKIDDLKI